MKGWSLGGGGLIEGGRGGDMYTVGPLSILQYCYRDRGSRGKQTGGGARGIRRRYLEIGFLTDGGRCRGCGEGTIDEDRYET